MISKCLEEGHVCTPKELKDEISRLLFNPPPSARDKEILSINIPSEKAHAFDFLRACTKFKAIGRWRGEEESDTVIQIMFHDTKEEEVGEALVNLTDQYITRSLHEKAAYAYTSPVEESTL